MKRKLIIYTLFAVLLFILPLFSLYPTGKHEIHNISDVRGDVRALSDNWQFNGILIPETKTIQGLWNVHEYQLCSDGSGGAYVLWVNISLIFTPSPQIDKVRLYVQRVNSTGGIHWNTPVLLFTYDPTRYPDQTNTPLAICPDEAGGAIAVWSDIYSPSSHRILAQRIHPNGSKLWANPYVTVKDTAINSLDVSGPQIVSDGAGGVIITWEDRRVPNSDIYIQHLDSGGTPQLTTGGLAICSFAQDQKNPMICSDLAGGAIVAWMDFRSTTNFDIYAQHVPSSGIPQWTTNGLPICTAMSVVAIHMCSDGSGGAIITWEAGGNICAQRVASGAVQWTGGLCGPIVCDAPSLQAGAQIASDGAHGCYITWQDLRSGDYDIFVQRLNSTGAPVWQNNGIPICNLSHDQYYPQICPDNTDGAVITWQDYRNSAHWDIFAQHIDATGQIQLPAQGDDICSTTGNQEGPLIVNAGKGNVLILWVDLRGLDIYGRQDLYISRISVPSPSGIPGFGLEFLVLGVSLSALVLVLVKKKEF